LISVIGHFWADYKLASSLINDAFPLSE